MGIIRRLGRIGGVPPYTIGLARWCNFGTATKGQLRIADLNVLGGGGGSRGSRVRKLPDQCSGWRCGSVEEGVLGGDDEGSRETNRRI